MDFSRIARVFPRKTNASPDDDLAFFGPPTLMDIAKCQEKNVECVHISVSFSWDIEKAEQLFYDWEILGVPVEVGGPAFDDRMSEDFTPGMYLKKGLVITSRGCTKDCWFCSVAKCAHGAIKELPVQDGWNVMDDCVIGTSRQHFLEVTKMLKRQKERIAFTGGIEPSFMTQWHADLLRSVNPDRLYTAYDTKDDLEAIRNMRQMLKRAGFKDHSHQFLCYVLIGYNGDTFDAAEKRLMEAMDADYIPFAMLYRDESGVPNENWRGFQREWANRYITASKFSKYWKTNA